MKSVDGDLAQLAVKMGLVDELATHKIFVPYSPKNLVAMVKTATTPSVITTT